MGLSDSQAKEVLNFWFEEIEAKQHFVKDPDFDALIIDRFMTLYEDLSKNGIEDAKSDPAKLLAAIIVLDQFSRNMFRDLPQAFAEDSKSLELTKHAIETGMDTQVPLERRSFLYMPLMHSENLEDQKLSVEIFKKLAEEKGTEIAASGHEYAIKHMEIIERFGRFPHRNPVLGRKSTPEEEAHFAEHGGF